MSHHERSLVQGEAGTLRINEHGEHSFSLPRCCDSDEAYKEYVSIIGIGEHKLYTAPPQPQSVKDALEAAAKTVDEMVDWPIEKHPLATIIDSYDYLIGIRRGLINATNAIRALIDTQAPDKANFDN